MQKTVIGISRDHSGSMRSIAHVAAKDYNSKIDAIKEAALSNNQDTIVSVVECGYARTNQVRRVVVNSSVTALKPIDRYIADGSGTPLFDSVGDLIEQFEALPDANDPNVSFLVMAITDGAENASKKYSSYSISNKIKELQKTDRWTFVFRVPRGYSRYLANLGIQPGNILEWDQTEAGVNIAAKQDTEAFTQYFATRSAGQTSTQKFYTNIADVKPQEIAAKLEDISPEVLIWPVSPADDAAELRPFVEARLHGSKLLKGAAHYQLTKTEPIVQDYKNILIRDQKTQAIYFGSAARQILGLPASGNVRLAPGKHGQYDIFIQSTSVNRKLKSGTSLVYWEKVGVKFKEGVSSY